MSKENNNNSNNNSNNNNKWPNATVKLTQSCSRQYLIANICAIYYNLILNADKTCKHYFLVLVINNIPISSRFMQ